MRLHFTGKEASSERARGLPRVTQVGGDKPSHLLGFLIPNLVLHDHCILPRTQKKYGPSPRQIRQGRKLVLFFCSSCREPGIDHVSNPMLVIMQTDHCTRSLGFFSNFTSDSLVGCVAGCQSSLEINHPLGGFYRSVAPANENVVLTSFVSFPEPQFYPYVCVFSMGTVSGTW